MLSTAQGSDGCEAGSPRHGGGAGQKLRDVNAKLAKWEQAVENPSLLRRLVRAYVQSVDLTRWPEVIAFQTEFLRRKAADPTRYARIKEMIAACQRA